MSTDRELLELAAKAAGYVVDFFGPLAVIEVDEGNIRGRSWDPLNNDGDALRLAVKLNMGLSIPVHRNIRADVVCFLDSSVGIREEGGDAYAATRRAIVRAAAEIGRQKTTAGDLNG